jgi:hypothetical protein
MEKICRTDRNEEVEDREKNFWIGLLLGIGLGRLLKSPDVQKDITVHPNLGCNAPRIETRKKQGDSTFLMILLTVLYLIANGCLFLDIKTPGVNNVGSWYLVLALTYFVLICLISAGEKFWFGLSLSLFFVILLVCKITINSTYGLTDNQIKWDTPLFHSSTDGEKSCGDISFDCRSMESGGIYVENTEMNCSINISNSDLLNICKINSSSCGGLRALPVNCKLYTQNEREECSYISYLPLFNGPTKINNITKLGNYTMNVPTGENVGFRKFGIIIECMNDNSTTNNPFHYNSSQTGYPLGEKLKVLAQDEVNQNKTQRTIWTVTTLFALFAIFSTVKTIKTLWETKNDK